LSVILHAGEASLKSQMKRADASGAAYAVIVGEREAAETAAAVKALRAADAVAEFAQQQTIALDLLAPSLAKLLRGERAGHAGLPSTAEGRLKQ